MKKTLCIGLLLASLYASATPIRTAGCMTGDSLTYGYTFDNTPIADRLATLLGVPVANLGVGSDVASNISARWTRYCEPYLYEFSVWEGCTNDFGINSATGADCWSTTQTWVGNVEAAGQRAAGLSVFCRGGSASWTDAKEAQRLAYNVLAAAYAVSHPTFIYVDMESTLCDPAVAATGTVTLAGGAGDVTVTVNGTAVGPVSFNTDDTTTAADVATALNANGTLGPLMTASSVGAVITITWDTTGTGGNVTLSASRTAGSATASGANLTGGAHSKLKTACNWGDQLHITATCMQYVAAALANAL